MLKVAKDLRDLTLVDNTQILLDLFRYCLHDGQFLGRAYGSSLSPNQSLILDEINRGRYVTQGALAKLFNLHQSNISRAIHRLITLGYLSKTRSDKLNLSLTSKGSAFIKTKSRFNSELVSRRCERLSAKEISTLESLITLFADYSGAPQIDARTGESPIFIAIRRLTYSHGLTNGSYFGSDVSSVEWSILSEIFYDRRNTNEISNILGIKQNTLSLLIKEATKLGHIQRDLKSSGRSLVFKLTKSGRERLQTVENKAIHELNIALCQMPEKDQVIFITYFAKYLGYEMPNYSKDRTIYVSNRFSRETAAEFDWIIAKELLKLPLRERPPTKAISSHDSDSLLVAYKNKDLIAAMRFRANREGRLILNASAILDRSKTNEARGLILDSLPQILAKNQRQTISRILDDSSTFVWLDPREETSE